MQTNEYIRDVMVAFPPVLDSRFFTSPRATFAQRALLPSKPSISVSSWFTVCSRSSFPSRKTEQRRLHGEKSMGKIDGKSQWIGKIDTSLSGFWWFWKWGKSRCFPVGIGWDCPWKINPILKDLVWSQFFEKLQIRFHINFSYPNSPLPFTVAFSCQRRTRKMIDPQQDSEAQSLMISPKKCCCST